MRIGGRRDRVRPISGNAWPVSANEWNRSVLSDDLQEEKTSGVLWGGTAIFGLNQMIPRQSVKFFCIVEVIVAGNIRDRASRHPDVIVYGGALVPRTH